MRLVVGLCATAIACGTTESPTGDPVAAAVDQAESTRAPHETTVVDRIEAWNAGLSPEDRHAKYCKMAASPFSFLRGANHLFWERSWSERRLDAFSSDQTRTWTQGDLHVANFGAFDNDDGDVVYDLNDFDEAIVADYQLDLWRLGASLVLVARANLNRTAAETTTTVEHFVASYAAAMDGYAVDDSEDDVVFTAAELDDPLRSFVEDVDASNSRAEALEDWTIIAGGERELDVALEDLEALTASQTQALIDAMPGYRASLSGGQLFGPDYLAIKSAARRLNAGTGSLGTPRFYLLIEGPTGDNDDDRILDVKLQSVPTGLHFAPAEVVADYEASFVDHAQRHMLAYRALANDVDDHLGVIRLAEGDFSVRERSVFKKSFDLTEISGDDYLATAAAWGTILASAHARADVDFDPTLIGHSVDGAISQILSGRAAELSTIIATLATEFADRTEVDWALFTGELAPLDCP